MSALYSVATLEMIKIKAGLLLASDSTGNFVLLGVNNANKAIEIALQLVWVVHAIQNGPYT